MGTSARVISICVLLLGTLGVLGLAKWNDKRLSLEELRKVENLTGVFKSSSTIRWEIILFLLTLIHLLFAEYAVNYANLSLAVLIGVGGITILIGSIQKNKTFAGSEVSSDYIKTDLHIGYLATALFFVASLINLFGFLGTQFISK